MTDHLRLPDPVADNWDWQRHAACRGLDATAFFHPAGERGQARRRRITGATAICATCPVIDDCRAHALNTREPYGIWGGMSEEDRAGHLGLVSLRHPARAEASTEPEPGRPPTHSGSTSTTTHSPLSQTRGEK